MPDIRVYSRQGCHPCELLLEALLSLVGGRANVVVVDIDRRDDWRQRYDTRVPVVELEGLILCEYTLDPDAVLTALSRLAAAE